MVNGLNYKEDFSMIKFKSMVASFLAVTLAFAPTAVMADQTNTDNISVQINGSDLSFTDTEPVIVNNRVFVPFRAVFEGLNTEEISYEADTNTIGAKKGTTEVEFTIGEKTISVIKDGKEETIETDAASFIKDDRTYIPVRFAAQALDCNVGWDEENKTAIIVEKDIFAPVEGETYELMNKYMAYQNKFSEGKHSISGKLNLKLTMQTGEETSEITGDITLDGLTDASNMNMAMALKLDIAKVEELLKKEIGEIDKESQDVLDIIKNLEVDYMMNMETGKFYVKCDALSAMTGVSENTWYLVDLGKVLEMSGMKVDFKELMKLSKTEDFAKQMKGLSEIVPLNNKYATSSFIESMKMVNELYADSAYEKVGNEYVGKYTMDQDGAKMAMEMAFTVKGEEVNGYSMKMVSSYMGAEVVTMEIGQKGMDATVSMKMGMEPFFSMDISGGMKFSPTLKNPVKKPASDATIVDVMEMFSNLMVVETVVETEAEATIVEEATEIEAATEVEETLEVPATPIEEATKVPAA